MQNLNALSTGGGVPEGGLLLRQADTQKGQNRETQEETNGRKARSVLDRERHTALKEGH